MRCSDIFLSIVDRVNRLRADQRGSVAIIMGFLMIPLVGTLALGFEVSNWYMTTRAMQNAADAAAIAAATNGGANYDVEAKAVAAAYGFVDGVNTVSVVPSNTEPCPAPIGGNTCYSVRISGLVPLLLSQVVGFKGDETLNGSFEKRLNSLAVATPTVKPDPLCMVALASSGAAQGIRTNGAPTGNMNGCNSMSNTAAQCNGSNLGLGVSYAVGSNNGCGNKQASNPPLADPYISFAGNIPALASSGCAGNYPQETKQGNHYTLDASNPKQPLNLAYLVVGNTLTLVAGNNFLCGDQLLTGDVTVNTPVGQSSVLIIENGQLDLNAHVFRTSAGSALTIVFSGTDGGGYIHAPTDNTNGAGGVLDITAPTTGPWAGVAIYQDPNLTTGLDVSAAGNSPTWNITGLIYMPHASVTLKGAIDKSTSGQSCVVLIADNFQISGNGGILKTDIGNCGAAGLKMPTAKVASSTALVQ